MNTDSIFEIGVGHDVCQDYTIQGTISNNIKFATVCDGCSASHDVSGQGDVGSRILAFANSFAIAKVIGKDTILSDDFIKGNKCDEIINLTLDKANKIITEMGASPMGLDSTIVTVISDDNKVCGFVYGDGVVFIQKKNGEIICYKVEYPSGAPYYISYVKNLIRRDGYIKQFGSKYTITTTNTNIDDAEAKITQLNCNVNIDKCVIVLPIECKVDELKTISALSDGVETYESMNESGQIITRSGLTIMREIAIFRSTGEKFVKRRFNMFNRKVAIPNKMTHYDDVSIASIMF